LLIDESSYGPEHPNVAIRLNNLGQLYQDTNRFGEAEPLMRRALSIDESSYGGDHPTVARDLNNLALLLLVTNRLVEAEPLMRRALMIFVRFQNGTGYEHPSLQLVINNYTAMLRSMGRTEIQIAHEREAIAAEALRSN
jgi:tetratricopeptide (TPR) repeat protein